MSGLPAEAWIEVNLVPARERDEALLTGVVADCVHGELREEIETWFFFWEPELRLRLRWRRPQRAAANRALLHARLERSVAEGQVREWFEGAHGRRGEIYTGEAESYGPEVWPALQNDWMNGSELALLVAALERRGELSRPRDYHWARHVHLFTNQLAGGWQAEVELCLAQAVGYLRLLRDHGAAPSRRTRSLVAELERELAEGRGGR